MLPYFELAYGNPGSLHFLGQEAMAALDKSREVFSRFLKCDFRQILFTSSATEVNNLALKGAVDKWRENNSGKPKIIVSGIEHESVLETARYLEKKGVETFYLPVNKDGEAEISVLEKEITPQTVLVSIIYANNEVGTLQNLTAISEIINGKRKEFGGDYPLFHSDAVQAFQFTECVPGELGLDLMTLSSHKIYGPKGAALLYARDLNLLEPLIYGGGQEFGLRSGTENIPAIVGFAKAAELVAAERQELIERISALSELFVEKLSREGVKFEINGLPLGNNKRIPGILNVCFPGKSAEELLTALDLNGLAASAGSACRSRSPEPSYVLEAMGLSGEKIKSSLRFSFGAQIVPKDIEDGVIILMKILKKP